MKNILLIISVLIFSSLSQAMEISEPAVIQPATHFNHSRSDSKTFVVQKQDLQTGDILYYLVKKTSDGVILFIKQVQFIGASQDPELAEILSDF